MKHNPAMLLELGHRHANEPKVRVVIVSEGIGADWLRKEAEATGLAKLRIFPYQPFNELQFVTASGGLLVGIFITMTRSLIFPVMAGGMAATFCFMPGARWRQHEWLSFGKCLLPVGAAVTLVASPPC